MQQGLASGPKTATYNALDQVTSTTSGSTPQAQTYNGRWNTERTTSGADTFTNGLLGLTKRVENGQTTRFIREPSGRLIAMKAPDGISHYYTTDVQGSVILLSDTNQVATAKYTYDSWGLTTRTGTVATTNPFEYHGGYWDAHATRLKLGARYYNPWYGRFTQTDPSMQEQNSYAYAANNPISNTDPTGLLFIEGSFEACFAACFRAAF